MNGLSCFGNFSMGELGNVKNLTLNSLKSLGPVKFQKLDAGKCSIPGFAPPQLPTFVIPPLPLFGGIPPFSLFCLLPPFPGIPALSLPSISIALPSLPFIPPIPLPIPGFSIPTLPTLPSFDLGSLSFLCGLINIKLPIFDPFAGLNKLITKLNGLIAAFNDFLNFCKTNAEAINATQSPPDVPPSVAVPSTPAPSVPINVANSGGGLSVPTISSGDPTPPTQVQNSQAKPAVTFANISAAPSEPAENMAIYLANEGIIPAEPSIINKAAALLAPFGTIGDLTVTGVQKLFADNNIPSAQGFVGFQTLDIDNCLETACTPSDLIKCLTKKGILSNNSSVQAKAFSVLSQIPDLCATSGLIVASALNSQGVPYGNPATNLSRITADDVARAFYIKQTTAPLTAQKIVNVLVATGIMDSAGQNIPQALVALTPLFTPTLQDITPDSISTALTNINPGPSQGSLKAACIAATTGINSQTLLNITKARSEALLQAAYSIRTTPFAQVLSKLTLAEFTVFLADIPFPFPMSIYDIVPVLAVKFDIDDSALTQILSNFHIPAQFNDISTLFNFISFVAQTVSSQQAALIAIQNCASINEGDFSFSSYVAAISTTLRKYSLTLPSTATTNNSIANALQIENKFSYVMTISVLGTQVIQSLEGLTFLLLATGIIAQAINTAATATQIATQTSIANSVNSTASSGSGILSTPIIVEIRSPTKVASDINTNSINITLNTLKVGPTGVVPTQYVIMQNGSVSSGVTVALALNDFSQVYQIVILRITGFDETLEAINKIDVVATFSTAISTASSLIPQNLINVEI